MLLLRPKSLPNLTWTIAEIASELTVGENGRELLSEYRAIKSISSYKPFSIVFPGGVLIKFHVLRRDYAMFFDAADFPEYTADNARRSSLLTAMSKLCQEKYIDASVDELTLLAEPGTKLSVIYVKELVCDKNGTKSRI